MWTYLVALVFPIELSTAINIVNLFGWIFSVGFTIGYIGEKLKSIDQRLDRLERWMDKR